MSDLTLSSERKERIQLAFKIYWLSPFCTGTILLGEPLLSWALNAELLEGKAFADAYDRQHSIAYQIKTGLPSSPITFARLTTKSQELLVNSANSHDMAILAQELLEWVRNRIQEPKVNLRAKEIHIARIIYTKTGDFTYYERLTDPTLYNPDNYTWQWSVKGNALELYQNEVKWFAWYPQGRLNTKNQNQLHFHGENHLIPTLGASNRLDFQLGQYGRLSLEKMAEALSPLLDDIL